MPRPPHNARSNEGPSGDSRPPRRRPLFVGSDIYRRAAFGKHHPLKIMRHSAVLDLVRIMDWLPPDAFRDTVPATLDQLLAFHDRNYLEALQYAESAGVVSTEARARYHIGTMENPVFEGLFERAAMTVGGSIMAAELAMEGHVVFHPSGGTHHGRPDRASGFCYFNDPVFAILTLKDNGADRVLYIDLDAHHGDGVEAAFAGNPQVLTLSLHEAGRWPYSGERAVPDETAVNLPVPRDFNDTEFEYLFDHAVLPIMEHYGPDAIVLCCGADCLDGDPLSGMRLSNTVLWDAIGRILAAGRPTVILGGGGYNPWTVARYWAGLWARINDFEIPHSLPAEARELLGTMECDLIDEEDVEADWLTTMADTRNRGPLREEIRSIARAAVAGRIGRPEEQTSDVA